MVKKSTSKLSSPLKRNPPESTVVFLSKCWHCGEVCHFADRFCTMLFYLKIPCHNTESLSYFSWLRRVHDVITDCTLEPVLIIIQQSRN